jgi:hypothetical protein
MAADQKLTKKVIGRTVSYKKVMGKENYGEPLMNAGAIILVRDPKGWFPNPG